jgi:hypothetical protein
MNSCSVVRRRDILYSPCQEKKRDSRNSAHRDIE